MPVLRKWPAEPEAGPLRRLCRLHQLSGMQIHPPDRRQAGRRRCRPGGDRRLSRYGREDHPAHRPLRALCAAGRRRQAQAQRHSQGHRQEPMSIWRWRSSCCRCRAKSGLHPEDGKKITANFGRFGPYVAHDGIYASLDSPEDVFEIGLNRAVTLLAEKKAKGPGRRGAQTLKDLGAGARRQADQGAEGQVRSLCQRRRDQCHPAGRHRARRRDHGTGAGADRRTRGQGRQEEKGRQSAEGRKAPKGRKSQKPTAEKTNGAEKKAAAKTKTTTKKKAAKPAAKAAAKAPAKPPGKPRPKCPSWQANRDN